MKRIGFAKVQARTLKSVTMIDYVEMQQLYHVRILKRFRIHREQIT